ncbi:hypothetical protein [Chitinophaga silvisoli]|uniref:Uncharacterized protein n=1 Tax=Chitinophaga silvisoli TaxID=2291814 RepID=A0A3E1NMT4_9BACT|nr:hypothetical protein [Chitinophaga silvisoli]RFM29239.1 hypothetical protein DXN04_33690 [Chitinophaga silvisoli]
MDVQASIDGLINVLKERPLMVLNGDTSYYSYKLYIEGFLFGLSSAYNINLILNITLWFRRKIKIEMDVFWTDYIPIYYKDETEDELKKILLQTLSNYFEENPEWKRNKEDK